MFKIKNLLFLILITGIMFMYGCADNLKDTSQYSSVDNSNNSTDTDTGDNQGSGDNTGTDTGNNQGNGDNAGTDTGDNQGSGDNTGTDTGDNQGSGDNTGTDTGDNQGSGDNTGTDTGDNQGNGGNTGTDDNTGSGNTDTENPDKKYTVTFHDNGADSLYNSMPPLTECTSKGIEITENRFLKTGYKFVGWSTAPNDEMIYRNMQVIKCTDNVDLYALWEENPKDITGNVEKFRIFFNNNGGDGVMGSMEISDEQVGTIKKNTFTRNGYDFAGWSTSGDNTVVYADEGKIQLNESITLYAVWNLRNTAGENTVKVILDPLNNGENTETFYVNKGQEFYADYNKLTNGDKVFAGWSKTKNSNKVEYQEGIYVFFNEDTTLYGVWLNKNDVYEVKLDCNGGLAINMPDTLYIQKGNQLYLPKISCDLYNRKSTNKYSTNPEEVINAYVAGNTIDINQDMHLYALWSIDDFALEYSTGGNCIECANQTFFGRDIKVPEDKDWALDKNLITYSVVWEKGVNWFHVYQNMLNLCWAATASNAFHWWTTVNDKYIQAYYKYKESKGETISQPDLYYDPIGKANYKQSGVFWEFSRGGIWGNVGNNPATGFIWLTYGAAERPKGAYFKEIFENSSNSLASAYYNVSKRSFNETATKILKEQKGVMAIGTVTTGSHVITLWGVTYDENGYINGVYTTDSAYDGQMADGRWGGLDYDKVIYNSSGKPFMQNAAGYTFPFTALYVFHQNEDDWIRFFKEKGIELPQ